MKSVDNIALCPQELHRYIKFDRGLDLIQNKRLCLSHISEYNDPFEFLPASICTNTLYKLCNPNYINNYNSDNIPYKAKILEIIPTLPEDNFADLVLFGVKFYPIIIKELYGFCKEKIGMYQYEKFKELHDFLGKTKLCCFSEDMDNILMWSHYANNHKGMVISLNTNMTYWGGDINFKKVHYTSEAKNERIPMFDVKDRDINCHINSLITTKASFWSYEKEWRYIKHEVQNCPSFIGDNNKEIHYQKIDPQSISKITLGLNVLEKQVSQILEIVRNNHEYKHIIVQQVKLDNIKYKFRFNILYSEYII